MRLFFKEWGFLVCSKHVLLSTLSLFFFLCFSPGVMSGDARPEAARWNSKWTGAARLTSTDEDVCGFLTPPLPPAQLLQPFLILPLMLSLLCPWELEVAPKPARSCYLTGWLCPLSCFPGAHTSCSFRNSCFGWLESTRVCVVYVCVWKRPYVCWAVNSAFQSAGPVRHAK